MMGWGYGYGAMNGFGWPVFGLLGFILWLIVLVDLILAGLWLWRQLRTRAKKG